MLAVVLATFGGGAGIAVIAIGGALLYAGLLFAFGRMSVADVEIIGEDADVAALLEHHRGF